MRRDVWRVGIGRFCFEAALGALLAFAGSERDHFVIVLLATLAAVVTHFVARSALRRSFIAAHVALAAAAIPPHFDARAVLPSLAVGLGIAIELTNVDHVQRRRLTEHIRSPRVPSSLLLRRLGSIVVVGITARAALSLAENSARPMALTLLSVVLGAFAALSAGFDAGPGRPITRPVDAAIFVLLGIVLVIQS